MIHKSNVHYFFKDLRELGQYRIWSVVATFFLSPFLKIGLIVAYFNLVGKIPDIIDLLKM